MRLTFCEKFSYSADSNATAESTCSRSLARSDQAARRKPAGTESQVEPTTGGTIPNSSDTRLAAFGGGGGRWSRGG